MTDLLNNKVALVIGGGSGIGRASAIACAREGAQVVVADVHDEHGQAVVAEITASGGEACYTHADVSVGSDVEAAVATAVSRYGRLDCAHNNVGILMQPHVRLHELPEATWDRVLEVNLKGTWMAMKFEITEMLRRGAGSIVNTASIVGLVATPPDAGAGAYSPSKHGVVGLTKTAALEYAGDNIRVNAVCPCPILTPALVEFMSSHPASEAKMIAAQPQGRLGQPAEVAEAVVWLCSDASSCVTGHAMVVDGGFLAR